MATPFLGEIKLLSFNFPPKGWAFCNGQFLPINQNQALFSLLGTTFGGNGQTTFALPDNRGRTPIHVGGSHTLGERGGEEAHTLNISELPTHTHAQQAASGNATTAVPSIALVPAASVNYEAYRSATGLVPMAPTSVTNNGGSQSHVNMQPFLTLSFCIALQGIFPSPN